MPLQTKPIITQGGFLRKIGLDFIWVPVAFIFTYAISSYLNIADEFYDWASLYEKSIDIDELLPALLASLMALLWFANRRTNESRILIKKNHALLQRILEVQEDERKRIARDLHDDLGQYLSAIKAQAISLQYDSSNVEDTQLTLKRIISSANHAFDAARNMIRSLRPVALDDLGLSAALEHLIDTWQSININPKAHEPQAFQEPKVESTHYQLHIHNPIDGFHEKINIALFRIVQEALTNIAKHAKAKNVSITITHEKPYLTIAIADNGIGFDKDTPAIGYGLLGIAERAEVLGGTLDISSQLNIGTTLTIQLEVD